MTTNQIPQPIGIYSIAEVSFAGQTEAELTDACVPFEAGVSRYRELARGQIAGDSCGVLKLLVSPADRELRSRGCRLTPRHCEQPDRRLSLLGGIPAMAQ